MRDATYKRIASALRQAGASSPYESDANEPDPRYKAYGVRAPQVAALIRSWKHEFAALSNEERVALAHRLIASGYGEQKTVALHLLDQAWTCFGPARFRELESLVSQLHGWSKIDQFACTLARRILDNHESAFLKLLGKWNMSDDQWLQRASVVVFTRKVAESGRYTSLALDHCERLKHSRHDLVLKGVGWALKDLMRAERQLVIDRVVQLRREGVSSVVTLYAIRDLKGPERKRVLQAARTPVS